MAFLRKKEDINSFIYTYDVFSKIYPNLNYSSYYYKNDLNEIYRQIKYKNKKLNNLYLYVLDENYLEWLQLYSGGVDSMESKINYSKTLNKELNDKLWYKNNFNNYYNILNLPIIIKFKENLSQKQLNLNIKNNICEIKNSLINDLNCKNEDIFLIPYIFNMDSLDNNLLEINNMSECYFEKNIKINYHKFEFQEVKKDINVAFFSIVIVVKQNICNGYNLNNINKHCLINLDTDKYSLKFSEILNEETYVLTTNLIHIQDNEYIYDNFVRLLKNTKK